MSEVSHVPHQDAQPESLECDYLVVGAGATGLAFADTLLHHSRGSTSPSPPPPRVLIVDKHEKPGGHWNDSYGFVRLHQPSAMYGVESEPLEPTQEDHEHRATREEILAYYGRVVEKLTRSFGLRFIGGANYDFQTNTIFSTADGKQISLRVQRKVVDARWLQPDLPVSVPPKFAFDPKLVHLVTPNDLVEVLPTESSAAGEGLLRDREEREERTESEKKHVFEAGDGEDDKQNSKFVIVGAGKTGMDAVVYLQTVKQVAPEDILWIVPTEMWITARENICSCMEFLATCVEIARANGAAAVGADFLQRGFVELEKQGKFYRLLEDPEKGHGEDGRDEDEQVKDRSLLEVVVDHTRLPAKFKDATLCKRELEILRRVPQVFRGGRLREISWNPGSKKHQLNFADGSVRALPWQHENDLSAKSVTFVHCSAGAFNYTRVQQESGTCYAVASTSPPVFSGNRIVIQDVYGTPGFCFVGSVIGKIETLCSLSDEEKNRMCRVPQMEINSNRKEAATTTPSDDGGGVGALGKEHGLVQRLCNLRDWYETAGLGPWLHGDGPLTRPHRLFNLNHLAEPQAKRLVNETHSWIAEQGLLAE
eukprot:g10303.t1